MIGNISLTTWFVSIFVYYFASLDRNDHDDITNEWGQRPLSSFKSFLAFINRRDYRNLAICLLWGMTLQVSFAIGHLHTDPNGSPLAGLFALFAIFWFNPLLAYFSSKFRNILSQMSPSEISYYLFFNILAIDISSITPMICLSLDTIKYISNAYRTQDIYDQYSGVSWP